jgi:hypothetical protein
MLEVVVEVTRELELEAEQLKITVEELLLLYVGRPHTPHGATAP